MSLSLNTFAILTADIFNTGKKMAELLIYGASGYTGRLISEYAQHLKLDFFVAGRSADRIKEIASTLHVPYAAFDVTDMDNVDSALKQTKVLLNCAGPFLHTAEPLMKACIRNGVHYLDIAAEMDSYRLAELFDDRAREASIVLLPGCGGSVAMLGCLAAFAIQQAQSPQRIDIALHVAGSMSRGYSISAAENVTAGACLYRVDGNLVEYEEVLDNGEAEIVFDFGDGRGQVTCTPITLPDLITLSKSTSVANISTYVNVSGVAFSEGDLQRLPDGPSATEREANPYHAAVAVTTESGSVQYAVLHTVNGYTFTSRASIEAAKRVLQGEIPVGFETPASCFGADFVHAVGGSFLKLRREEEEAQNE